MNEKELIIELIETATDRAYEALNKLKEINKSSQFDYTTSSKLSNSFDELNSLTSKINKIIYQKQK
jgi:hypothetical protein